MARITIGYPDSEAKTRLHEPAAAPNPSMRRTAMPDSDSIRLAQPFATACRFGKRDAQPVGT